MRWNGIENPNLIEVGQVLRVSPPSADSGSAAVAVGSAETRPVASSGRLESRPLGPSAAASAPSGSRAEGQTARLEPAAAVAEGTGGSGRELLEGLDWGWPAAGPMIAAFDDAKGIKGLAISGKSGDPVLAAADGRVIYAGSGLRGYGNLVIVRHNANFLSAYAHNQTLLVKEDQAVRKGQKIAEMGSSDADRVKLHFEIRRKGLPVDPSRFLPAR